MLISINLGLPPPPTGTISKGDNKITVVLDPIIQPKITHYTVTVAPTANPEEIVRNKTIVPESNPELEDTFVQLTSGETYSVFAQSWIGELSSPESTIGSLTLSMNL